MFYNPVRPVDGVNKTSSLLGKPVDLAGLVWTDNPKSGNALHTCQYWCTNAKRVAKQNVILFHVPTMVCDPICSHFDMTVHVGIVRV